MKKSVIISTVTSIAVFAITIFGISANKPEQKPIQIAEAKTIETSSKITSETTSVVSPKVPVTTTTGTITTHKSAITTTTTTEVVTTEPEVTETESEITETKPETEYDSEYTTNNTYFDDYEMTLMCAVVSSETGYCDDVMQKAVAHTIINRVNSDMFPNTISEVLNQPGQYTAIDNYYNGYFRPGLEPGSDAWNHTMDLCYEALNEYDFTYNAYAYYNPDICGWNSWFESLTLTYCDSCHRFFTW